MGKTIVTETPPTADVVAFAFDRFRAPVEAEMRAVLAAEQTEHLAGFYGQMAYHLGWMDADLRPAHLPPGKLLRPALTLWSCEFAALVAGHTPAQRQKRLDRAVPAAAAVELLHNFSLIHDDIEDRDELRRHRRTVWSLWGEPQGINTGDGMFVLSRLALWRAVARGVPAELAIRAATLLDRTALTLCEGQYLDMAHEARATVTEASYLDMIDRKTAALMSAAAGIGGLIGSDGDPTLSEALREMGRHLGIGFQLRDDLLGIWAETGDLGKRAAGDLRRKKMSLPIIAALAHAQPVDRARIRAIYDAPGPATDAEIADLLAALEAAGTRDYCRRRLATQTELALRSLTRAKHGKRGGAAGAALTALIQFVAAQP